jgi:hypothetical protein
MKITHRILDSHPLTLIDFIYGESQTGTVITLYSRTTYRNLKQKEEEEKTVHLCSNRLLVCNLPHEEEP